MAALLVFLLASVVAAQSQDDYLALLDTYATDPARAVDLVTALTASREAIEANVAACLPRNVQFAGDVSRCRGVRRSLAIMLHTEAAVRTDVVNDSLALFHLQQAMRLVPHVAQPALVEKWYEFAVMFLLSRGSVSGAAELADNMANRFPDSAVPHYLRGVVKEVGVMFGTYPTRILERAADDYERAMRQDANLVDARLRWGRVASILMQPAADAALATVARDAPRPATRYLANLFLGSFAQRRRQLDAALRHYEAARDLEPQAQTACIAVSSVHQARGELDRATTVARACLDRRGEDDPWWPYRVGAYDVAMVAELRSMAMRP